MKLVKLTEENILTKGTVAQLAITLASLKLNEKL